MAPPLWECERDIILKVVRIVQSALACSSSSLPEELQLHEGDVNFAKKFLHILITQNDTFASFEDDGNGTFGISTSSILNTTTSSVPSPVGNAGKANANSKHRLQNLELIKVGVLIVVISIIMLTTCRMIFQLFVRFRPEKPQG